MFMSKKSTFTLKTLSIWWLEGSVERRKIGKLRKFWGGLKQLKNAKKMGIKLMGCFITYKRTFFRAGTKNSTFLKYCHCQKGRASIVLVNIKIYCFCFIIIFYARYLLAFTRWLVTFRKTIFAFLDLENGHSGQAGNKWMERCNWELQHSQRMVVGLSPSARSGDKNHIDCGLTEPNSPHIWDVNTKLLTTVPSACSVTSQ